MCDWLGPALSVSTEPVKEFGRGPKEMSAGGDPKPRDRRALRTGRRGTDARTSTACNAPAICCAEGRRMESGI